MQSFSQSDDPIRTVTDFPVRIQQNVRTECSRFLVRFLLRLSESVKSLNDE